MGYQERNEEDRKVFIEEINRIPKERIVYIDEAGVTNRLYRSQGRSPRGVKVYGMISGKRKERVSMIGGWINHRFVAPMSFKGGCNEQVVNAWLREILLPDLKTGTFIIMDNAAFHKSYRTRTLIEEAGCFIKFLPAYSPDLNPIEHCWHTLKALLKPLVQPMCENLHNLVDEALLKLLNKNIEKC